MHLKPSSDWLYVIFTLLPRPLLFALQFLARKRRALFMVPNPTGMLESI
jgi:hypothetical protein